MTVEGAEWSSRGVDASRELAPILSDYATVCTVRAVRPGLES